MNFFLDCNQDCNASHGSEKENKQYNQYRKDLCFCNRVKDYNCAYWDSNSERLVKTTFQILLTKEKYINYIMDGQIVRMYFQQFENRDKVINRVEELNNIEQIKYLLWFGQYNQDHNKVAKWSAIWNGDQLLEVGGYYSEDGLKQGITQIKIKFMNMENIRMIYENKIIGGGSYNKVGKKKGKWVELGYQFQNQSQVTYCGEYIDGEKIGLWDIYYQRMNELRLIGGGSYFWRKNGDDLNSKKVGIWTELVDGFQDNNETIQSGEYKNDQKISKWIILRRENQCDPFQQICGGSQENKSEDSGVLDSIKIGKWIEFRNSQQDCYVTQSGQYNQSKKVGRWESFFQGEQIGGESYEVNPENEESLKDPIKFWKWIELIEEY